MVNSFMKNEVNRAFMAKKTIYQTPCTSVQPLYYSSVLCSRGTEPVSSNVDIHGGDQYGDVQQAF